MAKPFVTLVEARAPSLCRKLLGSGTDCAIPGENYVVGKSSRTLEVLVDSSIRTGHKKRVLSRRNIGMNLCEDYINF